MVTFVTPDTWQEFIPPHDSEESEELYQKMTKKLVEWSGHEHTTTQNTHGDDQMIGRADREKNFENAITYLNDKMRLGLEPEDIALLVPIYVALSETHRFGEDVYMDPRTRENTASHSLHTPVKLQKILHQATQKETAESCQIRQLTGLALLCHDLGEALGEPGSMAQEVNHKNFSKDKPEAEKVVMRAALTMAAYAQQSHNAQLFYEWLDKTKSGLGNINTLALQHPGQKLSQLVEEAVGTLPTLEPHWQKRVNILSDLWELVEDRAHTPHHLPIAHDTNIPFISYLASLCEHAQGTSHFVKFLDKDEILATRVTSDAATKRTIPFHQVPSQYLWRNASYTEGEVGHVFAQAQSPLEQAIAHQAKKEIYTIVSWLMRYGPAAVIRSRDAGDYPAPDPKRKPQIGQSWEKMIEDREENGMSFGQIVGRDDVLLLYDWALHKDDFISSPGQILLHSPPKEFLAILEEGKEAPSTPPRG